MLLKILGILFIFLIVAPLIGKIIRLFSVTNHQVNNRQRRQNRTYTNANTPDKPQKKFKKEEGEYVSYEEIKEE